MAVNVLRNFFKGGLRCETKLDPCLNFSCSYGKCVDNGNCTASCMSANNCQPNNCLNGASCVDILDDYVCKCPCQLYTGKNCDVT